MKVLLSCLLLLIGFPVSAQSRFPGSGVATPQQMRSDEDWRLRREQMQTFRQEMREMEANRREEQRAEIRNLKRALRIAPPQRADELIDTPVERPPGGGLRRLSPEERQRLRQEMREAYRR